MFILFILFILRSIATENGRSVATENGRSIAPVRRTRTMEGGTENGINKIHIMKCYFLTLLKINLIKQIFNYV